MSIKGIIKKIKNCLPDIEDIITFYNSGIIYSCDFTSEVNIPLMGKKLAEIIEKMTSMDLLLNNSENDPENETYEYKRIIYESEINTFIILKLGEDSNVALIFPKKKVEKINLNLIHTYLEKLEDILDTTNEELLELGIKQN